MAGDKNLLQIESTNTSNGSDQIHAVRNGQDLRMDVSLIQAGVANNATTANAVLKGGVIKLPGNNLDYYVWASKFIINSTVFTELVTAEVTLSNGDATFDRFDIFAIQIDFSTVNNSGFSVVVLEGTPSANPLFPSLDLVTQVEVGTIEVPALATEDTNTQINKVYDENVEWTNTTLTTGGTLTDNADPYSGLINFETPATVNDSVSWTDSGLSTFAPNDVLTFAIKSIFNSDSRIQIKLINSSNNNYFLKTLISSDLVEFGVAQDDDNWQVTQVNLSEFQPNTADETQYDRIEFTFLDTLELQLDRIEFQKDLEQFTLEFAIVNDTSPQLGGELDMNGHSVGGDPQTATGDGTTTINWKLGNFFEFQFGAFNEVFTFTNPSKAGTFILRLVQDSVGSRTATFPASVKWIDATAPTLTTIATTGTDIITFYFDGTNYFGVEALNFS